MIFKETKLKVNDNSGATKIMCIKLLGKSRPKNPGKLGDFMVITVKEYSINKKALRVKPISKGLNKSKGDKESRIRAIISKTKYRIKRFGSYYIKCNTNSAILLDRHLMPWGTRLFGPIFIELNNSIIDKVFSLGKYFI